MADLNGGALLARCLANEGVRFVFGLPSPEIDPLLAALEEHGIRLVPFRHESAGAHMAEGLYKTTGQVAVVIGNPGPGSANLVGGVITARHEGVPMIAITSQHRLGLVYPSLPSTFQGQDQLDVFKPVVKWGGPIFSWDRIPDVVRVAFREMWTGRPGPVHIELPAPVLYATGDESTVRVQPPAAYRAPLPEASDTRIAEVADLLASAARPLVIAGSGVDRAGADQALLALVDRLGCPILTSMAGRAVVPHDHPHASTASAPVATSAKREADVVLVVGSRLGNLDLPYDKYWGDPATQRVIQIDVDPRHLGVTRPLALGIVADVKQALETLVTALATRPRPNRLASSRTAVEAADEWWRKQMHAAESWKGPGLHPAHVVQAIGRAFGRDAIYVTDGGFTSLWAYWFLPPTRPRSYLEHSRARHAGDRHALGAGGEARQPRARGGVCHRGRRRRIPLHGDAVRRARGCKITTIVFAEGSWCMEIPNELMLYGKNFGTEMGTVRWDMVAQGLGCKGLYAETLPEVEAALGEARESSGPVVICVRTDRAANLGVAPDPGMRFAEVYQGPM